MSKDRTEYAELKEWDQVSKDLTNASWSTQELEALQEAVFPTQISNTNPQNNFVLPSYPSNGRKSERKETVFIPSMEVPLPDPSESEGWLGSFLPTSPALVQLVGESSAGKTVLCKNIAYHMAEGKEWLGIQPARPFSVVYADLESPENLFCTHAELIGRSDNLVYVHNELKLDTELLRTWFLEDVAKYKPDIVFIDALPLSYPVHDEDDNAEADRQMQAMKSLATSLDSVVVVLWNMGKGETKGKFRARGASSRIDRCDVAINYTDISTTARQLEVVKSRYGTGGAALQIRFNGDLGFELLNSSLVNPETSTKRVERRILSALGSGSMTRKELVSKIGEEALVDKTLKRLRLDEHIVKVKRGYYALDIKKTGADL